MLLLECLCHFCCPVFFFFEKIGFELWLYTGCPKRYKTFQNMNKSPNIKLGIPKHPKYKIKMSKNYFKALLALSSVNSIFLVTSNMVSPNKSI